MWASLWEQARAVPARRQKRLFDDTREAEKVVQWVAGLSPGDAAQLLLPCIFQVASCFKLISIGHFCASKRAIDLTP